MAEVLYYAIPFFVLLLVAEQEYASFRHLDHDDDGLVGYDLKDTGTSLSMGIGNAAINVGWKLVVVAIYAALYELTPLRLDPHNPLTWVAMVLAEDLTYYWFHRISHERRFWWAAHVNHHSSQHYNLSTALRQTWTGGVAGTWALWLPLAFLGFPPAMIAIQKGISLVYQYWIHTEAIRRLPRWFEAVFNTPSHHRVHHARNPRYLDRNYAGILIVWDRLFGTFQPETRESPYGLTKNLGTFNIIRVAFHEWIGIAQDVRHTRGLKRKAEVLLRGPGWGAAARGDDRTQRGRAGDARLAVARG